MAFDLPVKPVDPKTTKRERLDILKQYYLKTLVEDPIHGTIFDNAVLAKIRDLRNDNEDERLRYDPQEDDPKLGPIIKEAAEMAKQNIYKKYDLRDGMRHLGIGYEIWTEQKRILKEKGINWKSPREMNPYIVFD